MYAKYFSIVPIHTRTVEKNFKQQRAYQSRGTSKNNTPSWRETAQPIDESAMNLNYPTKKTHPRWRKTTWPHTHAQTSGTT